MGVVYDVVFYDFSHGFREGHSQHKAISELREECLKLNIGWIVSADITGLFDTSIMDISEALLNGESMTVEYCV